MRCRVLLIVLAMAVPAQVVPARAQQPADLPVVGLLVTHAAVDDPIFDQLEIGKSPGRVILDSWEGEWARSLPRLIDYARY